MGQRVRCECEKPGSIRSGVRGIIAGLSDHVWTIEEMLSKIAD